MQSFAYEGKAKHLVMVMFPGFFLVTKFGRGGDKNYHRGILTVILGLSAKKNLFDINVK